MRKRALLNCYTKRSSKNIWVPFTWSLPASDPNANADKPQARLKCHIFTPHFASRNLSMKPKEQGRTVCGGASITINIRWRRNKKNVDVPVASPAWNILSCSIPSSIHRDPWERSPPMNYSCMYARFSVLHLMHGMQRCQTETAKQVPWYIAFSMHIFVSAVSWNSCPASTAVKKL